MLSVSVHAADSNAYDSVVRPLLDKYCVGCHGAEKQKGDLRLDQLDTKFDATGSAKWRHVLERVELGQMPPKSKPRPTVEEIRLLAVWVNHETERAELERRAEQLVKHRESTACAGCHSKIDPPGFALESFDCIGGWRNNYRLTGNGEKIIVDGQRMRYNQGKQVDSSDVTEDGQPFQNIDEFKQLLLRDKDQLARALIVKLLTYGTGSTPTTVDRTEIDTIIAKVREKNYGFRSLVHEVIQSNLFQYK